MGAPAQVVVACDPCPHVMFPRCPACRREQYAPAVWAISHGVAMCVWCSHLLTPVLREDAPPAAPLDGEAE